MKTSGYLKMALSILYHSKIRSWLTIIGVVIGIASVVTIVSLGDSLSADMNSQLSDMDLTLITITPGYSKASSDMFDGRPGEMEDGSVSSTDAELTKKDIRAIKLIGNISYIDGRISGSGNTVYFMGESASLSITGVDPQVWQYMSTYELESGRLLDPADNNVAVIGYKIANEVFDNQISVNRLIKINDKSVRVVGILADGEDDNAIYMPIDAAVGIIEDAENEVYDSIVVQVNDANNVKATKEKIETKLMISRNVMNEDDKDFTVSDTLSMTETINEMMSSLNVFLGAIAAVSLIVGSVGIANTMFTSVMEKTKEIGTMKSIGATNKDVLMIFIFNSGMVGFVGGIIGIILSMMVTYAIGPLLGLSTSITIAPYLVVLGISIAVLIGVASGIIPAYNASKMKPVDALRYE